MVTLGTLPSTVIGTKSSGSVGQFLVEALVDGERPGRGDQQRVPVRLGLRREIGADVAAGAGLLLDDDRLAPLRLQLVGGDARQHVVDAASRERHDELDRLARKRALRIGGTRQRGHRQRGEQIECDASFHAVSHHDVHHSGLTPDSLMI